ncbi:hypothetical protein CC86DRAFT_472960 [Ophiobolus disseminans]|uniref:Uncharacterized protein n=1 Tax=Ophiobolus disseminans TaxID=1469910 RepID=A0A6A6ZB49_9PLEO|nr:hypothetical protein CC86DRAFT_472960 [Ophiobolus disseminans]
MTSPPLSVPQLSDGQLDEQLCHIFNTVRQRLYERNTTIINMRLEFDKERATMMQHYQALKNELALKSRKNENLGGTSKGQIVMPAQLLQDTDKEWERTPERSCTERYDTHTNCTTPKLEQSEKAPTLRQRRMGKAATVSSLTVTTQSCTPSPQAIDESDDEGWVPAQRKRARRSRRKELSCE